MVELADHTVKAGFHVILVFLNMACVFPELVPHRIFTAKNEVL